LHDHAHPRRGQHAADPALLGGLRDALQSRLGSAGHQRVARPEVHWRDLTLRRSRDTLVVRAPSFHARYEIVPVGLPGPGRKPVPHSDTARPGKYKGKPIPLFLCGEPFTTNDILVTKDLGDVSVAINNGILSTQNLRKQLKTPQG